MTNLGTNTNTGSIFEWLNIFDNFCMTFFDHRDAIIWAHSRAKTQKQKTIKVINFCNSSYSWARIMSHRLLFDTNRRCQPWYFAYFCFFWHSSYKHPSIGWEAFQVPSLPFIAECGESKRGFAWSTHTCHDGHSIFFKRNIDISEIMGGDSKEVYRVGHKQKEGKWIRQYRNI